MGWTGSDPGTKSSYQNAITQNPNTESAHPTPKHKSVALQLLAFCLWHSAYWVLFSLLYVRYPSWRKFSLVQQFYCVLLFCQFLTQEPVELETSRFQQKFCLITSSRRSRSNIEVGVPNPKFTLKQKFCYINSGRLIKRSHYLPLIITFVCMLVREKRIGCNNPIVLVV